MLNLGNLIKFKKTKDVNKVGLDGSSIIFDESNRHLYIDGENDDGSFVRRQVAFNSSLSMSLDPLDGHLYYTEDSGESE